MMPAAFGVIAAIPYRTFPQISIGPLNLFVFGLFVALGMFLGVWVAARQAERHGIDRDRSYRLAFWLIIWGVVGARLAWVLGNMDDLSSPLKVFALWEGGLTFTGGFALACVAAIPMLRKWRADERWFMADAIALGLPLGLAIGRIGCYAVGEHLGGPTSFFLGVKYLGGVTREGPLTVGVVYHNTALYETLQTLLLFAVIWFVLRKIKPGVGVAMGIFCVWYGVVRFGTDFLRIYDKTVFGLTAAQYVCVVLAAVGVWIIASTNRRMARLGLEDGEDDVDTIEDAVDVADDAPARAAAEPASD